MKKLYLVASAVALILGFGFMAWKFSNKPGQPETEAGKTQSSRDGQDQHASDAPVLSNGQVITMPPSLPPSTDSEPAPAGSGDNFKLPPTHAKAEGAAPAATPTFVVPPSIP